MKDKIVNNPPLNQPTNKPSRGIDLFVFEFLKFFNLFLWDSDKWINLLLTITISLSTLIENSTIEGQTQGYPISSKKLYVPSKTEVAKSNVSTLQPTVSSSNILSEFSHYSLLTNLFSSSPNTRSSSSVILSVPQKISSSRSIKISTSSSTTISLDIINLLSNSSLGTKVSSKSPNQITFTQYSAQDTTIYRSGKYLTMGLNDNGKVILPLMILITNHSYIFTF